MNERSLFAAANSAEGFYSFYGQIFDRAEIKHRYLIKGGPGTGKSSFMRRAASVAESAGLGVEYYFCSSDPTSLDGIVIQGSVALIDATSPHCVEVGLAGARDEIIDLGVFWNADGLESERGRIEELSEEKSRNYRSAYRFLAAAGQVELESRELCAPYINRGKMHRAAERVAAKLPNGTGYRLSVGVCDSIGMKGRVRLDTYERLAKRVTYIDDTYKCGSLFLSMLIDEAMKKKNSVKVSYSPLTPNLPDVLLFEDCGEAFVLREKGEKRSEGQHININMKRFVTQGSVRSREVAGKLRQNGRMCRGLIQSACDSLARAGECHFQLEEIYKSNMDFKALERFGNSFCQHITKKILCKD